MGRRWAAFWAREDAVKGFFLGKDLGRTFYSFVHPPPPTTPQVFMATTIGLVLLALFSTGMSALSYPTRGKLGIEKKQLEKLIQSVEDKLILRFTKGLKQLPV